MINGPFGVGASTDEIVWALRVLDRYVDGCQWDAWLDRQGNVRGCGACMRTREQGHLPGCFLADAMAIAMSLRVKGWPPVRPVSMADTGFSVAPEEIVRAHPPTADDGEAVEEVSTDPA